MTPYSLKAIAERRSGRVVLPPIEERVGSVIAYRTVLRRFLRALRDETRRSVLPAFRREIGLTQDMATEEWFRHLRRVVDQLVREADGVMRSILRDESERHTERFIEEARRALGVDLNAVVRQEDLTEYLEAAAVRNVGLIQSLGGDVAKRVEQAVITATLNGQGVGRLKKTLTEQFKIADRRAQLIARTEIAKMNGELNKLRQQQAGVTKYEWRTSADERVRSLHRQYGGQVFPWKNPPSDGHPGTAPNCRCTARGIVEF